jgi:hypothetical protein
MSGVIHHRGVFKFSYERKHCKEKYPTAREVSRHCDALDPPALALVPSRSGNINTWYCMQAAKAYDRHGKNFMRSRARLGLVPKAVY